MLRSEPASHRPDWPQMATSLPKATIPLTPGTRQQVYFCEHYLSNSHVSPCLEQVEIYSPQVGYLADNADNQMFSPRRYVHPGAPNRRRHHIIGAEE